MPLLAIGEFRHPMRRIVLLLVAVVALAGCREVRVNQVRTGTTKVLGPNQILIIRDQRALDALEIPVPANFRREFVVVLLMGPHRESGYRQLIESIRPNADRIRVVAFEQKPLDGGEPVAAYRTYTVWIVPNIAYRPGNNVDVVTPSGEPIASTVLR
jgi:hypothetical protein